jgi:hypothetical protein
MPPRQANHRYGSKLSIFDVNGSINKDLLFIIFFVPYNAALSRWPYSASGALKELLDADFYF